MFVKDVNSLLELIEEMDNPFMDRTQDLTRLMSKDILCNEFATSMKNTHSTGKLHYNLFWKERVEGNKPLSETISKNN